MERLMVNTLHFNLSAPTPYVFMQRFLKAAESNKKPNMASPFALHQQQLAMLAQQQSILMVAAAAQSANGALKNPANTTQTGLNGNNSTSQNGFYSLRFYSREFLGTVIS